MRPGATYGEHVVLTDHARERCAEMGISTKVAKRIWRTRQTMYPGTETSWGTQGWIVTSDQYPNYLIVVVFGAPDAPPTVVTVAFRTHTPYVRQGRGFATVERRVVKGTR